MARSSVVVFGIDEHARINTSTKKVKNVCFILKNLIKLKK
jgi:hypothetical protein